MNWYTHTKSTDNQGLIVEEGTGRNVAVSYDPKDAALIAAAPALLEALEALTSSVNVRSRKQAQALHAAFQAIRLVKGEA